MFDSSFEETLDFEKEMEDYNNNGFSKVKGEVGMSNSEVLKVDSLNSGFYSAQFRQSLSLVKKESDMPEPQMYQITPCKEEETQFDISESGGSGAQSSLALIGSENGGIQQINTSII